jgi:hypothetical protein
MKLRSAISSEVFRVEPVTCDKSEAGIYIVGSSKHNWYKIGQSQNVSTRISQYRSLPFVIDVVRVIPCKPEQCRGFELRLQACIDTKRIRANGGYSEWFSLSPADLRTLFALADSLIIVDEFFS